MFFFGDLKETGGEEEKRSREREKEANGSTRGTRYAVGIIFIIYTIYKLCPKEDTSFNFSNLFNICWG